VKTTKIDRNEDISSFDTKHHSVEICSEIQVLKWSENDTKKHTNKLMQETVVRIADQSDVQVATDECVVDRSGSAGEVSPNVKRDRKLKRNVDSAERRYSVHVGRLVGGDVGGKLDAGRPPINSRRPDVSVQPSLSCSLPSPVRHRPGARALTLS